ncbi:hypothetical protein [Homoserinimonas hongtaonis]|uniref:hypothetical protein n=1 Tax=Homoserinimonas hongtaonis TaxID=2079791 RepID=UPI000D3A65FD|nr:hypothetical protein [Salinibacterium hongtaonis]AWB88585.1 hypothetical protein C2138_02615 [Salinibacterium hongtaonis]
MTGASSLSTPTRQRVACIHVHHGNIAYLDEVLAALDADGVHYVDPGLLARLTRDDSFSDADGRSRTVEQLAWMAAAGADALVVTCTAYAALVPAEPNLAMPVLVVDEPLFESICASARPRRLFFTNPSTVEPTITRLRDYAAARGVDCDFTVELIPEAFELFVAGRAADHDALLASSLESLTRADAGGSAFAMQLSMTTAARRVAGMANPLDSLARALAQTLGR